MKKKFACILLAMVTFLFSGCVTFPVERVVVRANPEEVTAIEVYYLEEPAYRDSTEKYWYNEQWNYKTSSHDFTVYDYQPIAYVNQEDYADFIADAKALPYTMTVIIGAAMDPGFRYYDYVVRIVSGDKEEIVRNKAGGDLAYCDEPVWQNFLKKYIGEEPFIR